MSKSGSGSAARGTGTRSGGGNGRTGNSVSGGGGGSSRARVSLQLVTETRNQGTQGVPEYTNRGNQSLNQTAGNKVTQAQVNAINNPAPKAAATTQTATQTAMNNFIANITPNQMLKMNQSSGYSKYKAAQIAANGGATGFAGSLPHTITGFLTKQNGMNNPPQVIDKKDFAKQTKGMTILYRAVGNDQHIQQFQTSTNAFDGNGIYGNGHYAANVSQVGSAKAINIASSYGSANAIIKMALPKTAKIISHTQLSRMMSNDPKWSKFQNTGSQLSNDMKSVYAMSKGYDAISGRKGIINVLNRSILIVQKQKL